MGKQWNLHQQELYQKQSRVYFSYCTNSITSTWKNTLFFHLCCYGFSLGRKSLYNTAVYVRNIYIVCRNDYQQSKNWLCHILSSHLFETLFFYSYFITILLKNIISWLTNYKITPGSLTCDTLTERCPGFFTCETFFVFFAWIIFAGALKFVMRNIYIFKRQ